jgi:hypothetical protein
MDNPVRGFLLAEGCELLAPEDVELPVVTLSEKTPSASSRHTTLSQGINNGLGLGSPGPRAASDGPTCMLDGNGREL